MRGGWQPRPAVPDLHPFRIPWRGEQQAGDELGGGRGVHGDGAAGERPGAPHGEGDSAPATVVDHRAEFAQGGQQRADRALRRPAVPVELHGGGGQRGDRWHEAHHRAGIAHIDPGVTGRLAW